MEFARQLGTEWSQELNEENLSGEITIVEGSYDRSLHETILESHAAAGNEPIDGLFCVTDSERPLPKVLQAWGYRVWDGTSPSVRDSFPTRHDEHRVVNYESCRGLEGWTVVCVGLDRYYNAVHRRALTSKPIGLRSAHEHAAHIAAMHTLIPLTRAMQHLVIQLDERHGKLYEICRQLHE